MLVVVVDVEHDTRASDEGVALRTYRPFDRATFRRRATGARGARASLVVRAVDSTSMSRPRGDALEGGGVSQRHVERLARADRCQRDDVLRAVVPDAVAAQAFDVSGCDPYRPSTICSRLYTTASAGSAVSGGSR